MRLEMLNVANESGLADSNKTIYTFTDRNPVYASGSLDASIWLFTCIIALRVVGGRDGFWYIPCNGMVSGY